MCIWIACIRWVHFICFPFLVPFAPIKRVASCLYSPVGGQHICLQCSICFHELEIWKGKGHVTNTILLRLIFVKVENLIFFALRTWKSGRWLDCGAIPFLASSYFLSFVLEFLLLSVTLLTTLFFSAYRMRRGGHQTTTAKKKVVIQ